MLSVHKLEVAYGGIKAVRGIDLEVGRGEVVALIGANGAGKSSTLKALSGLLRPSAGRIDYDGAEITGKPAYHLVRRGLAMVPEGRGVFPRLTVAENLAMGAYIHDDRAAVARDFERAYALFPRLAERRAQAAGTLSGGEQQMLAIGRALMGNPKFLMLDEPSLGIAPRLISTIFEKIVEINRVHGITILLVEQNANLALEVSQHAYVLETGTIVMSGESKKLRADPQLKATYLGG